MVDPLSIAAAAAGFLSLAGQLANGAIKLKSIISSMKNAPSDITRLCLEIEDLGRLLQRGAERLQQASLPGIDAQHYHDATHHCEIMRARSETILQKLNAGLQKSKAVAFKMPFKKDEIKDMLLELERAKTSLLLAQQAFESVLADLRHQTFSQEHAKMFLGQDGLRLRATAIQTSLDLAKDDETQHFVTLSQAIFDGRQESSAHLRDFQNMHCEESRQRAADSSVIQNSILALNKNCHAISNQTGDIGRQNDMIASQVSQINSNFDALASNVATFVSRNTQGPHSMTTVTRTSYGFRLIPFGITFEHSETTESSITKKTQRPPPKATRVIGSIRVPTWFLQQQYNVQIKRAVNGWTFSMRVHAVIPYNSPFFKACRSGDLYHAKYLLQSKQASINDRTIDNESALALAVRANRLDVCQFLLAHGIRTQFDTRDYAITLLNLCMYRWESFDITAIKTLMRTICPDEDLLRESVNLDLEYAPRLLLGPHAKAIQRLIDVPTDVTKGRLQRLEAYMYATIVDCFSFWGQLTHSVNSRCTETMIDDRLSTELLASDFDCTWLPFACLLYCCDCTWEAVNSVLQSKLSGILAAALQGGVSIHGNVSGLSDDWKFILDDLRILLSGTGNEVTPFLYLCETIQSGPRHASERDHHGRRGHASRDAALRRWVQLVANSGVDLVKYGEVEGAILTRFTRSHLHGTLCIHGFEFGRSPSDWRFWHRVRDGGYFRDFWKALERSQPIHVLVEKLLEIKRAVERQRSLFRHTTPGSWVDEDSGGKYTINVPENRLARRNANAYERIVKYVQASDAETVYDGFRLGNIRLSSLRLVSDHQ